MNQKSMLIHIDYFTGEAVAAYEPVTKQTITFDDLFNSSSLMAASLKKEYETYRAAAGKQANSVTFDQYKEGIQYSGGFDYQSIKDKQMDKEFWVNLGIGAAVVILTIACPPAGIAAGPPTGRCSWPMRPPGRA
ncbi:hypothetical protein [Sporolactobacillus sp. KGMB 08714]|uniref:hypothetical protein n=1 Tax=Sporolactobacillus sp. KGMB 08714 TaxID=3064704 RepID=UPI002FBD926B